MLASAIRDLNKSNTITVAPKDCDNSGSVWDTGKDLFNSIKKQVLLNGQTGKVAFDDQGDRINAEYNLVNIQNHKQVVVGQYFFNRVTISIIAYKYIFRLLQDFAFSFFTWEIFLHI